MEDLRGEGNKGVEGWGWDRDVRGHPSDLPWGRSFSTDLTSKHCTVPCGLHTPSTQKMIITTQDVRETQCEVHIPMNGPNQYKYVAYPHRRGGGEKTLTSKETLENSILTKQWRAKDKTLNTDTVTWSPTGKLFTTGVWVSNSELMHT